MDISGIMLILFFFIIIYLLWNQLNNEGKRSIQALLFNISVMFMDTRERRQSDKCNMLTELLGSFLNAEHVILKIDKVLGGEEFTEYHWRKENSKTHEKGPELILELKEKGEVLGTIAIRGTSAVNKLRKQKSMIASYIGKLVNRFFEDDKLYYMAYFDQLTELPNRTYFIKAADEANESARKSNEMVAYLFFDLDSFKAINDKLGHDSGDKLLKAVADRLCLNKSIFSMAARYGGDEYIIMHEHITKVEEAIATAEALVKMFEEPFILPENDISITASVGISLYPCHGSNMKELLINADKAMYQSKAIGKNRYDILSTGNECLYR